MKPIAGVFKLFCSGFDHLVAGQGREDIGESGQGCNIAATAQHHDSGGESDCATGGAAYEADFVVFLCKIEGLTGLAEEFLLECEVHDGLPIEVGWGWAIAQLVPTIRWVNFRAGDDPQRMIRKFLADRSKVRVAEVLVRCRRILEGLRIIRRSRCVGQGSGKKCRLKNSAIRKLEDGLAERFGDRPSDSAVAEAYGGDRETIGKVRLGQKWVVRGSIDRLFDALDLDLLDEDYEQDRSQPSQSSKPNPFGKPIECLDHLWVDRRREEYRWLKEAISKGGSQAIVGPAGCGKSSLVKVLGRETGEVVMHLDMHLVRDEGSFFDRLCDALDLEPVDSPSRAMLKVEQKLKRLDRSPVLCLDEIHVLTDERFFPEATRNWLKGMADFGLRLVVTSQRELRELFPDSSLRSSPLADFFDGQTLRLAALTRDEVAEFMDCGLRGTGVKFSEVQVEELWGASEGSLMRLHRSAQKLYDGLELGQE